MRRDDAEPWHRLCTRIRTGELHSHPGLESRRLRSFKQAAFLLQDGAPGLARAPTSPRNQAQIASDRISLCEKDPICFCGAVAIGTPGPECCPYVTRVSQIDFWNGSFDWTAHGAPRSIPGSSARCRNANAAARGSFALDLSLGRFAHRAATRLYRPGTRLGATVVRRSTCALASSTLSPARAARGTLFWFERLEPLPVSTLFP